MKNPPNNKQVGGPGKPGPVTKGGKSIHFTFEGDGFRKTGEQTFASPEDLMGNGIAVRSNLSPCEQPIEDAREILEQERVYIRDLMLDILQEDFGVSPNEEPQFTECGMCKAYRGGKCRLRAHRQENRGAQDGCYEGIPVEVQ